LVGELGEYSPVRVFGFLGFAIAASELVGFFCEDFGEGSWHARGLAFLEVAFDAEIWFAVVASGVLEAGRGDVPELGHEQSTIDFFGEGVEGQRAGPEVEGDAAVWGFAWATCSKSGAAK
jgi:hypothetical protein